MLRNASVEWRWAYFHKFLEERRRIGDAPAIFVVFCLKNRLAQFSRASGVQIV